ncbi:Short-chain dehydrogenase TIC 32, chloroplastic [Galdieria sulphuraria]|nr:Short-chain dehydrogenase TIC 32, chloroplastic [Galdieria sulphuraria]
MLWDSYVEQRILNDAVVVITGANSGIGKETARLFVKSGAKVILACRNSTLGYQVKEEFCAKNKALEAKIWVLPLDLQSTASIRAFVEQWKSLQLPLDYLILNAGVLGVPLSYTEDHVEMHFGVNHLGHFMLTLLLMENLIQTKHSRVVIVSSLTYLLGSLRLDDINYKNRRYRSFEAYASSKLCNLLFMRELCKRCKSDHLSIVAVHPGDVHTQVARHFGKWIYYLYDKVASVFLRSPEQGALSVYAAAVDPYLSSFSGIFTMNVDQLVPLAANATHDASSKYLWKKSLSLISFHPNEVEMLRSLRILDEDEYLQCLANCSREES